MAKVGSDIARVVRFAAGWGWTLLCSTAAAGFIAVGKAQVGWRLFAPLWARGTLGLVRIELDIQGEEHLAEAAVFACNHQSLVDVVFLPAIVPVTSKFIAKRELTRVPMWGWALSRTAGIMIDRRRSRDAILAIEEGMRALPPGWSVVMFPEGTRAEGPDLLPFKKGVCYVASATGLPLVPIGFDGAQVVLPTKSAVPRPGTIYVTVGQPIDTSGWTRETARDRLAEVEAAVRACFDASRARRLEAEAGLGPNVTRLHSGRRPLFRARSRAR